MIRLLKIIVTLIILLLFSYFIIKINNNKKNNNIEINYVNELNSELYNFINLYDFNNNTGQYECKQIIVEKENTIEYIFYYYNDDLLYDLENIKLENNTLFLTIKNNDNEFQKNIFKKMKLSYEDLSINKLIITYNNQEYIIN